MSYVTTLPELMTAAAGRLQVIGMAVSAANSSAAFPITGVVPAAADEVSALTAGRFAAYGQMYQTISAEAAAVHEHFVTTLGRSASSYEAAEAANAARMTNAARPAAPRPPHPRPPSRPTKYDHPNDPGRWGPSRHPQRLHRPTGPSWPEHEGGHPAGHQRPLPPRPPRPPAPPPQLPQRPA